MTLDEFREDFDRLVNAFSVQKPEGKADVYYDELKNIPKFRFRQIVTDVIRNSDRFPSIAVLLERTGALTPAEVPQKQLCNVCDGFGNVFIYGVAYRGDCSHGERHSKKIKVAPRDRVALEVELIRQEADWKETYGTERAPNKIMVNSHWWIEKA